MHSYLSARTMTSVHARYSLFRGTAQVLYPVYNHMYGRVKQQASFSVVSRLRRAEEKFWLFKENDFNVLINGSLSIGKIIFYTNVLKKKIRYRL
ncbi:MAG: hypothetical protein ACYC2P_02675 [Paludibacteraceae bacterium]